MILVIDNYDSFTYNLAQYLGELDQEVTVVRNDQITLDDIERLDPSHILISPGPGEPEDAGISLEVIRRFHQTTPILGVCLGHQCIGQAFGGQIVRAERLMHGKTSRIEHNGQGIFANIPSDFTATRYHSLIVDETLPDCLQVTARTPEGEMMALRHKEYPVIGLQFHPEAILTEHGHRLLKNFLEMKMETRRQGDKGARSRGAGMQVGRYAGGQRGAGDGGDKGARSRGAGMQVGRYAGGQRGAGGGGDKGAKDGGQMTNDKEQRTNDKLKPALAKLLNRKHLSESEAEAVMEQIMSGQATPAQIGAYLTALRMKGETVAEIVGSARAMRRASVKVTPAARNLVDTCGTGGDGAGTFNISTTAAFVVAGAGQKVAKHGNRSVSSKSGSADVLEALGVNLNLTPQQVADAIDQVGLGFMFAPKLHPAMKHAIGPRRELAARTIFNLLGPLTNPANAPAQIMGVYDGDLTDVIAEVLGGLGSKAAFVVHGHGGLDELTTTGPNRVSILRDGSVTTTTLQPDALGFRRARAEDLLGGDAQHNAALTRSILRGQDQSPRRDVTLLNAAGALVAGGKAADLREGVHLAARSIDSGAALAVLENLAAFSRRVAMA